MYWTNGVYFVCLCALARTQVIPGKSRANEGDYNNVNTDGSFDFGYANKDRGQSYHLAHGSTNGVVGGRFGGKDPATDTVKEVIYTAGPRGFRPKGPNVHRQLDLDQRPRGPIGNKDDPYFDPNEDPSYNFKFETRTYSRNENADSRGDVKGQYTFIDDAGERHDVSYIAGRDTGFHVSSAVPDKPNVIGTPFHRAPLVRGELRPRGRTAVQRGLDGSYRFISAGPDQRRTESSDSKGNVRGSYTFLDDKGVQRTVNYIAGPGIGYRIVKNSNDPYIPSHFPTIPSAYDPDFVGAGGTGGYSPVPSGVSGGYSPGPSGGSGGYSPGPSGGSGGYSPGPSGGVIGSDEHISTDDVFKRPEGTAASGHVKPPPYPSSDSSEQSSSGPSPSSEPGAVVSGGGDSGSSYQPTYSQAGDQNIGYVDEDVSSYGPKPTKGPGKPGRPFSKPYRPQKKPYVPLKPSQPSNNDDDDYDTNSPEFAVGYNVDKGRQGTTVIRNIGEDYFGVPPGVSVRAHVQSIDLYPFGAKPISPSEALEKDKT